MNAIQPSRPHLESVQSPKVVRQKVRQLRPQRSGALAVETTVKLAVNVIISGIAVSSLVHLLPYHQSIQTKLQEIRFEVKEAEQRVSRLQTEYKRTSDPQEAKNIMREQSHLVDPARRQIVLLNKDNKDVQELD
ncbi:hypothetical protein NIES2119_27955 [[Phormidium ambiguum] IAM M-71]|uniref:Uncharacterized protein n=1 Tax=[Phormidium ambiguum] IAM M-71 TaxID=454136 RepID=A0A1U7I671_9CYAN|nr:hypothetical protein [Phormidium ambiguum]OKH31806.1 hypothetical protein NIES2119_27955 [Phormidium ambiguum IAM M-71]